MPLSKLPREIIEQLIGLISSEDRISCYLACKSWREIFTDSVHSKLVVYHDLLSDLINPPKDNQPPCLRTRLLVRHLELRCYTRATDEGLYVLQKTFPNINHLHFGSYSLIPDNFGVTADWNIWKSLRELHIEFDQGPLPDIENKLVKMGLCLPHLKQLEIFNTDWRDVKVSFSLDDFETIHSHSKHLERFALGSNLLRLSETDLERMTNVSPATNMKSMYITSETTDHRWLCYFARKYPNLHTLDFSTSIILPNVNGRRSDTISLFQQVPLPFQHLTKLNLRYWDLAVEEDHLLFWDILHFHNVPLKHLLVHMKIPDNDTSDTDYLDYLDTPNHIAEACLPGFSKTIETFSLKSPSEYDIPIEFSGLYGSLYNIVDIYVDGSSYIHIDLLLCAAPRLRKIELINGYITVREDLYNSNRFGLQTFKLGRSDITSDVLRFLSFHCRNLDELGFKDSTVTGNLTVPGCQFIDMSYTRLSKLCIEGGNFVIEDKKAENEHTDTVLITRPIDDIPPKQDFDPNALPAVVGGQPIKVHYEWFYAAPYYYMLNISSEERLCDQGLGSYNDETEIITANTLLDPNRIEKLDSTNIHCLYEYTMIKLGHVSNFEILYSEEDVL